MKRSLGGSVVRSLRAPAIISICVLLPFIVLQVVNRRHYSEGFPFALFVFMWLLQLAAGLALMPVVRRLRDGGGLSALTLRHWAVMAALLLVVAVWMSLVVDQWPCFLGEPNCD